MRIDELKRESADIKKIADKGAEIILALINYISREHSQHLEYVKNSKYKSHVTYFGLHLVFRIEMAVTPVQITSQLKAYLLSYDYEPKETFLGVAYEFDSLGSVNRRWTPDEFPQFFIADVFTKLLDEGEGILLRP